MHEPIPGGFLVVFEGIDGAGKSTAARRLAEHCDAQGIDFVHSKEPTDGPHGRALRQSAQTGRLSLAEELELFIKDRQEHVRDVIAPALAAGKVVILDRYYFSTAAYQGARGADPEAILAENERFAPLPDLLLVFDLEPALGLSRVRGRGDAPNEFERESALTDVRRIFASLSHPNLVRIDAARPPDAVAKACVAAFSDAVAAARTRKASIP